MIISLDVRVAPWLRGLPRALLSLPVPWGKGPAPSKLWPALPHTQCLDFSLKGQSQPLS